VEGGLLLDVVVTQRATILELFASEDKTLLIWWDALFVLDFGLDVVDGVRGFNLEGDGFARKGLDEDLHLANCASPSEYLKIEIKGREKRNVKTKSGLSNQIASEEGWGGNESAS